ncbi:MAG: family 20 glycosylhydrolase [Spirochaetia bacterium]|nr:family 20 glycosylhydrolase [Spirochaetia bacterium]
MELSPLNIRVSSPSFEGIHKGLSALRLIGKRAQYIQDFETPSAVILDAPRLPFRGWLTDTRGAMEQIRYRIDLAYAFRYSHIFLMLDYAYAGTNTLFPFESHPHIGDPTRTKKEWIDLFNYVRARGMEPVPFFTSFSRVKFIVNKSDYKQFAVRADLNEGTKMKTHRNLDVANPDAMKLIFDLQSEIIDTLGTRHFHIGFDELHYDDLVTSPLAKEKNWKASDWIASALQQDAAFLRGKKNTTYIWADMFDPAHNGSQIDLTGKDLLQKIPKDVIMMDWKYIRFDMAESYPFIQTLKEAGFRAIGCPWYNPHNVSLMTETVFQNRALGTCMTTWYPVVRDNVYPELIRSLPLGGALAWQAEECDLEKWTCPPDVAFTLASSIPNTHLGFARALGYLKSGPETLGGDELRAKLNLPESVGLEFLRTPFKNFRGVDFRIFEKNGKPAALVLDGADAPSFVNGSFHDGLKGWETQNPAPNDIFFSAENQTLLLTRKTPAGFARVYQDLKLAPGKFYRISFQAQSESGTGNAWIQAGDGKGKWDDSKTLKAPVIKNGQWVSADLRFQIDSTLPVVRLNFSCEGKDSSARFREVRIEEEGSQKSTPSFVPILPVNAKSHQIHFFHTLNKLPISDDMTPRQIETEYSGFIPGVYEIRYEDGSARQIPLSFRGNATDWANRYPGRDQHIGLFGTLGGKLFVNLPVFSWNNPEPEKKIREIAVLAGNRSEVRLIVLGITTEE